MPAPGLVISLRVNPPDVMAVIDVLDYLGIPKDNLSFAQATKIVLASALESFRQNGIIPKRDGFDYLEMIKPFEMQSYAGRGAKLKHAAILNTEHARVEPIVPESHERRTRRLRYEELMFKLKADPVNFSAEDEAELAPLVPEFQ